MTRIEGRLTEADHKSQVMAGFDVPAGVTRMTVAFAAAPRRARGAIFDNLISLSLWGPAGPRGQRHNNPETTFSIEAARATPGYIPGPVEPGRWQVGLDIFRLLGPDPVDWRLDIALSFDPIPDSAPLTPRGTAPRGRGWFKGDLHSHTLHSDGAWTVAELLDWAQARRLDFLALTDHNTVSGHAELRALAPETLLPLGGMEMTTHLGHAVTLGAGWHEWRNGAPTGLTMPDLARAAMGKGALYTIAHPMAPGDPACTGCRWEFADMMPGPARQVEIWNGGPWSDYNEEGLALFRRWLAAGHRLVATAGSDIHGPETADGPTGFNHVEADDLTEAAVLAAVAAGRNYLSSGPRLVLTAEAGGQAAAMGGTIAPGATFRARWQTGLQPLWLHLVDSRGRRASHPATGDGAAELSDAQGFVMAELRDAGETLRAVTNPIFVS